MSKINKCFTLVFILLFIGCESFFPKYDKQLFSQQDSLIKEIDNSVDLSKTQENNARSALMAKKELHPHPYSLWELAAQLHSELSDEKIQIIMDWVSSGEYFSHGFNIGIDHKPHSGKFFDLVIEILNGIITDGQQSQFQEIINQFLIFKLEVEIEWLSGELNIEQLKSKIFANRNYFKTSIVQLLSENQYTQYEEKIEYLKSNKPDYGKHSLDKELLKQAKYDALNMTEEQILEIETLNDNFLLDKEDLNLQYIDEIIELDYFVNIVFELFLAKIITKKEIYTEVQQEIIMLHHALVIKAHKKYKFWKK